MRSERARFFKNAISNIVNGASSAAFAIILPYFFVRYLTRAEFGVWVLVLQLAAYVNYLNFGVQTAIGRYVSHAIEADDRQMAERILTAGIQILCFLAFLGLVVIVGLAWGFPSLFRQADPQLVPIAQDALLWVGSALAIGLPFSAFTGAFIGLQRNDIAAVIAAIGKFGLATALIITAAQSKNLKVVAEVYFAGSVLTYLAQFGVFLRLCRDWTLRITQRVTVEIRELASYCMSLVVWFLAMFFINGVDTTIVGFFDFRMIAAYGAAISIVSFFAGAIQAFMAPLIQVFAKLDARGETEKIIRLLYQSSFGCTLFLFVGAALLISISQPAFIFWLGPGIAKDSAPLFDILIVANMLRNSAAPYANYLVATGQQRRVMLGPLAEGLTNFAISLAGAHYFGAIGVAIGTLVGSMVGIGANIVFNYRLTLPKDLTPRSLVTQSIARPLLYASPLFSVLIVGPFVHLSGFNIEILLIVLTAGIFFTTYRKLLQPHSSGQ